MRAAYLAPDVALPEGTEVGEGVRIERGVLLPRRILLERGVVVERGVVFADGGSGVTRLRMDCRIGAGAVLGEELEVGRGAHVLPGSVVLASVPANAIVQGNPARIVGYVDGNPIPASETLIPDQGIGASRHGTQIKEVGVRDAALYYMPRIEDMRGRLTAGEMKPPFPFVPQRYFVVFDVPTEELRGEHAHRECQQFLICLKGSCRALLDDGTRRREVLLDRPDVGLYMPPMIWGTQYRYTRDAILLVFASHPYDPADYIRTYDDFLREFAGYHS
jgi:hypothetical protein